MSPVRNQINEDGFKITYLPCIDGVRAFSVIAVIMFHGGIPFLRGGFIGVDIFFVISGFLITSLLIKEKQKTGGINIVNFFTRRVLRLIPALIALLLIFNIFSIFAMEKDIAVNNFVDSFIVLFYSADWTRAMGLQRPDWLGHAWSLSIEEQFYIIWPFIFLVLLKILKDYHFIALVVLIMALASTACRVIFMMYGFNYDRIYNGLDSRADALLIGCLCSFILSSKWYHWILAKSLVIHVLFYISLMIIIALAILSRWTSPKMFCLGYLTIAICAAVIIIKLTTTAGNSFIEKVLTQHFIVWIGKISYGLYLWHYPIFNIMRYYEYTKITTFVYGTAITFIFSALSYYFIERPFLMLKGKTSFITPEPIDGQPDSPTAMPVQMKKTSLLHG